jgi:cytochrome c oxidase subunit 2
MMTMRGGRITGLACIVALSACSHAPMTYMRTFGPAADPITSLGWGLTIICSLVVALIGVLVLVATLRARVAAGSLSNIAIARPGGGLRWIYIGTGLSTLVLFALVVWTMFTLAAVASAPERPAFTIEIRAHQWWWEARYIDEASDRTFLTANELHIPIGKPVQLRLIGDDVIHSFWIPALAGKTDVIPGQTNIAWLEATQSGTFRGQCTEYCGAQHAHMAEFVIAESKADFDSWWTQQLADAPAPASELQVLGESIFLSHCAACHAVRGTGAGGIVGPDLTHLMSRRTLGAGTVPNDPESLTHWIANAQAVKPGCRMPALDLSHDDVAAVTAYVQTLL